jgi:transposase
MQIIDLGTGELFCVHLFVACLPHSDYAFAMALRTQGLDDVIHALVCCIHALGGAPQALVPDNMKTAVVKTDRYEPTINCAIAQKVRDHNQTRMQQRPYSRQECFLADEKPLLRPLPAQSFEIRYTKSYKVAPNNHVYLGQDKHYYSVPHQHIGARVLVVYTRTVVRIFDAGRLLAVHSRDRRPSCYTTVREHLCSAHQAYLDRSPQYYLHRAASAGGVLRELFERIFAQNRYPETLYKTCDGLLALRRKTDPETFERACTLAINHQPYTYRFVDNVLKNHKTSHHHDTADTATLPKHDNICGPEYYQQTLNLR